MSSANIAAEVAAAINKIDFLLKDFPELKAQLIAYAMKDIVAEQAEEQTAKKNRTVIVSMLANEMGIYPDKEQLTQLKAFISERHNPVFQITPDVYRQTPELENSIKEFFHKSEAEDDYYGSYAYSGKSETHLNHITANSSNEMIATISRNEYGLELLNTYKVMFVDVDIKGRSRNAKSVIATSEAQALDALQELVKKLPELGFRVYRTAGGLRYICTTHLFDVNSDEVTSIMGELLADPLYVGHCQRAMMFRARLNPKPWRVEGRNLDQLQVCRHIETAGSCKYHSIALPIVEYHDKVTKAYDNNLILA